MTGRQKKESLRLGALISGGKDSLYAAFLLKKQGHELVCAITIESSNPDSYMFHTPNTQLVRLQCEAMGLPLLTAKTKGVKEEELKDLKKALSLAKKKYNIEGVTTGALYSQYQSDRIKKICDDLGLKCLSPLWHMDQEAELNSLLKHGFDIILVKIAAEGLDTSWLGKKITAKDIDHLVELSKKHGLNIAGEGGEYESLVLDCPLFKSKLKITASEIIKESSNTAVMVIKKAELV